MSEQATSGAGGGERDCSRRSFLKGALAAGAGMAAAAAAMSPLRHVAGGEYTLEKFLQKNYRELSPEELERVLERIRSEVRRDHGVEARLGDQKPVPDVAFAYALNLSRCIGCRRCVHACVKENNQSRAPEIQYIRVLRMPRGTTDLEQAEHEYAPGEVPEPGHYYMPVQCQQCANPHCVRACPVKATWKEPDGPVVVDYDWCIGCRYCQAACPYWARRFNFAKPRIPAGELNPDMDYLSNRPRPRGSMEKCTFCLHRTRRGLNPACQEVCPVGARVFGNIKDPESAVSKVLAGKRVFVLKEDLGTRPSFYYFFDA